MGNASNPTINRLGKNQFWKNHWYSDTFNQNLHQDKILKTLIKLYLKSGLSFKKSPFYNKYWYNFKSKKNLEFLNRQNSNFFRRFFYNNSFLGIEHSYLIRTLSVENFNMHVWLLKFNGWIVFSFQTFVPLKKKTLNSKFFTGTPTSVDTILATNNKSNLHYKRLKFIITFLKLFLNKKYVNTYFF